MATAAAAPPSVYYDPHARCLRLATPGDSDSDGYHHHHLDGATLAGALVDSPPPFLRPGKLLEGEIVEIIDPNEEKSDNESGGDAGGLLSRSFVEGLRREHSPEKSREGLWQRQRMLQSAHALESQRVLRKHQKDWAWFRAKKLGEGRWAQLETMHQREIVELQTRQQREQMDLLEVAFDCLSMYNGAGKSGEEGVERATQTAEPSLDDAQVVASRPASSHESPLPSRDATTTSAIPTASLPDRITTDRNKADAIKAVMRNRALSREERQKQLADIKERYATKPTNTAAERTITEQRRHDLQSVMTDKSLGREEKQSRMAEIRAKYAALSEREKKRQETQDKIDRMKAQVAMSKRERGASEAGEEGEKEEAGVQQAQDELERARMSFAAPKAREAAAAKARERGHDLTESDRSSLTSESSESSQSSDSSQSSESSSSDESSSGSDDSDRRSSGSPSDASPGAVEDEKDEEKEESPKARAARNWNRAAVKAVTSNMVARAVAGEAAKPPDDDESDGEADDSIKESDKNAEKESDKEAADDEPKESSKERAARNWNRAAVKAVTANMVAKAASGEEKPADDDKSDDEFAPQGPAAEDAETQPAAEDAPQESSKARAASRWQKAAVKTVTSNLLARKMDDPNRHSGHSAATDASSATEDLVFDAPKTLDDALEAKLAAKRGSSLTEETGEGSKDPLEDLPTDRTPIKKLIRKLKEDDEELTILKLDGRKKIKEDDWASLFESLEDNATLTHLSLSRCDISDDMAVPLVLSLVENETLVALRLNNNKGLSDDTAKGFIKVLSQSNSTLKKLELTRTKVTKASTKRISELLEDRDDDKKSAKLQEERQKKIRALLSFTASDALAKEISPKVLDASGNELDASGKSSGTGASLTKGDAKTPKRKAQRRGSHRTGRGSGRGNRGSGRGNPSVRMSVKMATMGGDLANVGADAAKVRELRKLRGECELCGQKCFAKTMFKTTPLTIPNAVHEGRCLKCDPM